jgi:hypothetical protein
MNRRFVIGGGAAAVVAGAGYSYLSMGSMSGYEAVAAKSREAMAKDYDLNELVRFATLAANSHNTQAWKFAASEGGIRLLPDFARRTPVVDPDDHHLFASLGCAAENLVLAAAARGRAADVVFGDQIEVKFTAAAPVESDLFSAIPARQCTRSVYDGAEFSVEQLKQLEEAARIEGVDVLLITDKAKREQVLEAVVAANSAQLGDAAFRRELIAWLRFNPAAAMAQHDGLFSACSGNPVLPSWLANIMMPMVLTADAENKKYAEQVRSSSGLAVFVSAKDDKLHWFRAGRAYQRFALKATALGIRNAFVNQPVEVASMRGGFAASLGINSGRVDFLVRFGMAPASPMSLRRPVEDVMA